MITFQDLKPPFVVGILGGWGAGKSYFVNLMNKRLKDIQKFGSTQIRDDYVGHIYLVKFDAWTYAKGSLWSSLMYQILVELNYQLDLEKVLGKILEKRRTDLINGGISLIEIMEDLSRGENVVKTNAGDVSLNWHKKSRVTPALASVINVNYFYKLMQWKDDVWTESEKNFPFLAWDFWSKMKQHFLDEEDWRSKSLCLFLRLLNGMCGSGGKILIFLLLCLVSISVIWSTVQSKDVQVLVTFVSLVSALLGVASNCASMKNDRDHDEEVGTSTSLTNKVEARRKMEELRKKVWIREGNSIGKVVKDRISDADYAKELGLVHRVKQDLTHLSEAFLSPASENLLPRKHPRIILFVDDLDRCPPDKVVEMLEALQLLVKDQLFVVVVTLDTRFVSLALESEYKGVLHPDESPSGLDYLEKIIQLPFWVPPMEKNEALWTFLSNQMGDLKPEAQRTAAGGASSVPQSVPAPDAQNGPVAGGAQSAPAGAPLDAQSVPADAQSAPADAKYEKLDHLRFSKEEFVMVENACLLANVTTPRTVKRLVNVVKILKIIWHQQDTEPPEELKKVAVLVLAMCASKVKSVLREMRVIFETMEKSLGMPENPSKNLKDLMAKAIEKMSNKEEISEILEIAKWDNDKSWNNVKVQLQMVRSFSFLGAYTE
jgi:hypothetical protein